jgi:transposase-like protein
MPRKRVRKSENGTVPADVMERAVMNVLENKKSIRSTSKDMGISKTTLIRYIKNYKAARENTQNGEPINFSFSAKYATRQVFTRKEEDMLEEYIVNAAKIHHGLSLKMVKTLAYEFAIANSKHVPKNWTTNHIAGEDWLYNFRLRHPNISLRKPEATSLSRATSFNKHNISSFFENLKNLYNRHKFGPESIYNIDETGITTVHVPSKVLAEKKVRQIGKVTSGERGQLVTMCTAINALGNTIPPFFVFPRVNFKDHMLHGAPPGSAGSAYQSGWMTSKTFFAFMKHFVKHARCTKEKPVLVLLDNHESHISIPVLDFAKSNGIHILTFYPHTSHKMQPLDRTVFGPLKNYYNKACDSWMISNPGKPISIYEIAGFVGYAFPMAMTPKNIQNGFRVTGIWPYNCDVFRDDEFESSYVTDRPVNDAILDTSVTDHPENESAPGPSVTVQLVNESTSGSSVTDQNMEVGIVKTPQEVLPFPKAFQRKSTKGKKRGCSQILTDTPVKAVLEYEAKKRIEKKERQEAAALLRKKRKFLKELEQINSSSSSEIDEDPNYADSSENEEVVDDYDVDSHEVKVGQYVVTKFATKKTIIHYVGLVTSKVASHYEIRFMRRNEEKNYFFFPTNVDESTVDESDIVLILPEPHVCSGNSRLSISQMRFDISFANFNMR